VPGGEAPRIRDKDHARHTDVASPSSSCSVARSFLNIGECILVALMTLASFNDLKISVIVGYVRALGSVSSFFTLSKSSCLGVRQVATRQRLARWE
jgi:hypothetical protein